MVMTVAALCATIAIQAGKYQHFKVSTYIRAQDVARMDHGSDLDDSLFIQRDISVAVQLQNHIHMFPFDL